MNLVTTLTFFFKILDIFDILVHELDVNSYLGHFKKIYMDVARPLPSLEIEIKGRRFEGIKLCIFKK